jgi:hypothetical protein
MPTPATNEEIPLWLEIIIAIVIGILLGTLMALGLLGITLAEYLQQFFN